ncbi:LOW QUALITY PROTEIN: ADP-ribosylation factor-binding protein GGA1 [Diaphorina citri]|uniref:LOW QUALITY PROTEIN: ADP-ribosylation factor-binding protein GGA1 n=1 Tax=Diaphorina citri TaxID=121845 RepID=A0A3Q0IR40_DIACI|nr:LOW QUALITY PROTEIN: ADP-ribosylation factor-binding protein GGA1 [Diaphorina citri]
MDKQLDIITTSLEALLQRGTSPKNVGRDNAAIDAFCGLVNKEPECVPIAAKLIVSKMQSMQEWEALQALQVLEACMQHCGPQFHAEVGKFRFLNELIKLISPKYLGNLTPDAVRTEIIELLYLWTLEYPRESKIREAYEMLKKQQVVQSDPIVSGRRVTPTPPQCSGATLPPSGTLPPGSSHPASTSSSCKLASTRTTSCSILEDENQSKLLAKLTPCSGATLPPSGTLPPGSSHPASTSSSCKISSTRTTSCSILEDENQSKLLAKLLQSKKPEDLQAANKLIRTMVTEEEKKMEQRCKIMMEMESVNNNVALLTEMLDNYSGDPGDWDLIKELHTTCEGFRSNLVTLVQQLPSGDDDLFQLVISSNESLNEALAKYNSILTNMTRVQNNVPLLDMSSGRPSPQHHVPPTPSHLNDLVKYDDLSDGGEMYTIVKFEGKYGEDRWPCQSSVHKGYKLKLQPASSTSLPAFNPFLPSPAITQIMLVACPTNSTQTDASACPPDRSVVCPQGDRSVVCPQGRHAISLKFVISYEVDGESVSDMGEIPELPLSEN